MAHFDAVVKLHWTEWYLAILAETAYWWAQSNISLKIRQMLFVFMSEHLGIYLNLYFYSFYWLETESNFKALNGRVIQINLFRDHFVK